MRLISSMQTDKGMKLLKYHTHKIKISMLGPPTSFHCVLGDFTIS